MPENFQTMPNCTNFRNNSQRPLEGERNTFSMYIVADMLLFSRLELSDDSTCTPSYIEVGWRPPTKNVDRIEYYKLMMATTTGMVKDIFQGKKLRHRVGGLKPNTEYIFCVKAIYDDGSFIWSESRSYRTRILAHGKAPATPMDTASCIDSNNKHPCNLLQ